MSRLTALMLSAMISAGAIRAIAADDTPATPTEFRTAETSDDESLPWYEPAVGVFPPPGMTRYVAGELIDADHVNRTGAIRPDRTDAQRRGAWDRAVDFTLLPYGAIRYHGAPAALRDVPIGTHTHGEYFVEPKGYKYGRKQKEGVIYSYREQDFTRPIRLEDDFSYYTRLHRAWRVDSVDLKEKKLVVTGVSTDDGKPDEKPTTFDLTPATRVWQGRGIAALEAIEPGQVVQVNLTWATLFGPGRVTDVWIDDESRKTATERQLAVHRQHYHERGLPGYVVEVDDEKEVVSVELFDIFETAMIDDFKPNTSATVVVAEPSLRSYDQINDRKSGSVVSVEKVDAKPGSSGVVVRVRMSLMLEGYRPKRVVRVFPSGWSVGDLPFEERLWPPQ